MAATNSGKGTPRLIDRGRGGIIVHYDACTVSGCYCPFDDLFKPYNYGAHIGIYHVDLDSAEGCRVIDKMPAIDHGDGVKMAISGPMVNVKLDAGEIYRCPEPSAVMVAAMAGNEFGTLATLQTAQRATKQQYGALDSVDVETYARLWKEAGARLGRVHQNAIVWED